MKQKELNWYDPTKIKSYNKTLNFVIGGRGIGKTYSFKKDAINRFKKKENNFSIYVVINQT